MTYNAKYLDPKSDVMFKKIFSNPDLLISLLNALLPLSEDQQICSIEYLPCEIAPVNPFRKNTIVDVRCKDQNGRQFVVEMQMEWTNAFLQRVLFNASKAYVSQAGKGFKYEHLMPVYSLSLINDTYTDSKECIHHYNIVCDEETKLVIKGLHFTFIELPKFKPTTFLEKRMAVLWLRFLTEINDGTRNAPAELLEDPLTNKALEMVQESAMSEEELYTYDKFWDIISYENTLMSGRFREGKEEGLAEGRAEGILQTAKNMKSEGIPIDIIMKVTGLSQQEIEKL